MKHLKMFVCLAAAVFLFQAQGIKAQEIVIGFSGPLSGPAAEYGQDIVSGIDMAVRDINAAGGITVKGKKYTFRLERLDDRADPTQAVNNARRLKANNSVAVFNGVFTTLAPIMRINEDKGHEFLVMAYTSTPKATEMGNKLLLAVTVDFANYVSVFTEWALKNNWKKCAMVVTLGAYGDEWRSEFRNHWTKSGGVITADRPANFFTETDFTAPITAVLATSPDVMLVGGPSATTALFVEQARSMGYKGAFMLVDQAKQDVIANLLGGTKIMGNLIGTAGVVSIPFPGAQSFEKRFTQQYKRMVTWECALNYTATFALARAIEAAQTVDDVYKIREAFPKVAAAGLLGDHFPTELTGIEDSGRFHVAASVQTVANGKLNPTVLYAWWPRNQAEFDDLKNRSAIKQNEFVWQKN